MPSEIGNEDGERVIEERKIKIAENVLASPGEGAVAAGSAAGGEGGGISSRSSSTVRRSVDRAVGGSDYRSLRANPDDLRRKSSHSRTAREETDYRSEGKLRQHVVILEVHSTAQSRLRPPLHSSLTRSEIDRSYRDYLYRAE